MQRFIFAAIVLFGLVSIATAQMLKPIVGGGYSAGGGGGGFQGVGDTLSGAKGHWGVIAYSAATRGHKMLGICDPAGANCADALSDATTGLVSSTQVRNSVTCGTVIGTDACRISAAYDDSGANACASGVCDLTISTPSGPMPYFLPNASGSVPAIVCRIANSSTLLSPATFAPSQPLSWAGSFMLDTSPSSGSIGTFLATGAASGAGQRLSVFNNSGTLQVDYFAGSGLLSGTVTTGAWYAIIGAQQATGTSGSVSVNGSTSSGTVGNHTTTDFTINLCKDPDTGSSDSKIMEAVAYNADINSNVSALTTTIRTNGGGF